MPSTSTASPTEAAASPRGAAMQKAKSWKEDDMLRRDAALDAATSPPKDSPRSGSLSSFLRSASSGVRHLVSKKKRRFIKDGFDLDLAYITPQLIAMGIPATGKDAVFRNPASMVKEFLARYHPGACKVFNLCIEPNRQYHASLIGLPDHLVESHGHYDHNPMPLFCVAPFCRSVASWLAGGNERVVAIHCKAGKGRTGMATCAYMVWSGMSASAAEAMELYGRMRTHNGKGVTIPSQARYVGYTLEVLRLMRELGDPSSPSLELPQLQIPPLLRVERVVLLHAPDAFTAPGVYFTIELVHRQQERTDDATAAGAPPRWRSWRVYDHRKPTGEGGAGEGTAQLGSGSPAKKGRSRLSLSRGSSSAAEVPAGSYEGMVCDPNAQPIIAGDVKICVSASNGKTICAAWFHTAFIVGDTLELAKPDLDKAKKNKALPTNFAMRVVFSRAVGSPADEQIVRAGLDASARQSVATAPTAMGSGDGDHDDDDDEDDDAD